MAGVRGAAVAVADVTARVVVVAAPVGVVVAVATTAVGGGGAEEEAVRAVRAVEFDVSGGREGVIRSVGVGVGVVGTDELEL